MSTYLGFVAGGQWAVSRAISGDKTIYLYQDRPLNRASDAHDVLTALGMTPSQENLDEYFPQQGAKGRCPTLGVLELFCGLIGNTRGEAKQSI